MREAGGACLPLCGGGGGGGLHPFYYLLFLHRCWGPGAALGRWEVGTGASRSPCRQQHSCWFLGQEWRQHR